MKRREGERQKNKKIKKSWREDAYGGRETKKNKKKRYIKKLVGLICNQSV